MTRLSLEAKEAIMKKALSRGDHTLEQIARDNNVGVSSLQKWLRCKREGRALAGAHRGPVSEKQAVRPLEHLLATAKLDEQAIGVYCREQGIHSFQLKQWQDELMTHNSSPKKTEPERSELKALRNEIKLLKQDLHRKNKALAETSALLILKKKADLIWGELADA